MIKNFLVALFFIFTINLQILSDVDKTTVQYPVSSQTILSLNYTVSDPNPIYGANWIWVNGTSNVATFEHLFYSTMVGPAELQIKASNTYYAYMNGISMRSGSKYQLDKPEVYLSCGLNNLTIKVENTDVNATSNGLVFRIFRSDGYIPTCSSNGYYNYSSCACQCLGNFTCLQTQYILGYPACGCKCKNQGILNCNSYGQYFDQTSCSCQCLPSYCKPNFEQDPQTCNCRCIASTCATGTSWNYNQCKCL